jgi:hypothetical protein
MRRFLQRCFAVSLALIASALGHFVPNAAAVVIDDFSVGPITVVGPDVQTQSGLDPDHVLGGSRLFNVGQSGSGSVLEIDPPRGLVFESSGRGYFQLQYDFVSGGDGIDLTIGGQDRIRLTFGAIDTPSFTPLAMYVTLPPSSSSNGVSLYVGDWDDLILEFPFDGFPTSVADAQNLTLDVFRNPPGASLTIKSITTAATPLAGDYNRDGAVDLDDYTEWRRFFGISTRNGIHFAIASADGNADGRVSAADYMIWRKALSGGSPAAARGAGVPEPGAFSMLAVASLARWMILYRRSRRPTSEAAFRVTG